jgi:hypothetical protein
VRNGRMDYIVQFSKIEHVDTNSRDTVHECVGIFSSAGSIALGKAECTICDFVLRIDSAEWFLFENAKEYPLA